MVADGPTAKIDPATLVCYDTAASAVGMNRVLIIWRNAKIAPIAKLLLERQAAFLKWIERHGEAPGIGFVRPVETRP